MNKDLERIIEIPEGIEVIISGNKISVKGNGNENFREFNFHKIKVEVKESKIVLSSKGATKRESKMVGTIWAHIQNLIKGIKEGFTYNLEICNVHFPMNVKVEGSNVVIKSFLGEKTQRVAKILPNVNIDIKGNQITVTSSDIEAAGQTAANLEKATKVKGKDRRIFQDGIFITNKHGRKI
tara:strand:- start:4632 stop:5174 length:543 start_codon:yes stop_codon:yes gene_type:complete